MADILRVSLPGNLELFGLTVGRAVAGDLRSRVSFLFAFLQIWGTGGGLISFIGPALVRQPCSNRTVVSFLAGVELFF